MKQVKIKDEQNLVRDMDSMAVLLTDRKVLEKDRRVKESLKTRTAMEARLNTLTDEVTELRDIVAKLLAAKKED